VTVEDVVENGDINVVKASKKPLKCCRPCFNRIQERKNCKAVDDSKTTKTAEIVTNANNNSVREITTSSSSPIKSPQKVIVDTEIHSSPAVENSQNSVVESVPPQTQNRVKIVDPAAASSLSTSVHDHQSPVSEVISTPALPLIIQNPQSSANLSFLEKYSTGKVLGEGAFAIVKAGERKEDNTQVAIKIIDRAKLSRADETAISQEVGILSSVEHPNIVKLYEFYDEPDYYYMVMECIQGGELFDRIVKKTTYSEKEARDLAFLLLNTLKFLHDRNIVHRDLKPEVSKPRR